MANAEKSGAKNAPAEKTGPRVLGAAKPAAAAKKPIPPAKAEEQVAVKTLSSEDAVAAAEKIFPKLAAEAQKSGKTVKSVIGKIKCSDDKVRTYTLVVEPNGAQSAELK
jgi:hypothetical protein